MSREKRGDFKRKALFQDLQELMKSESKISPVSFPDNYDTGIRIHHTICLLEGWNLPE